MTVPSRKRRDLTGGEISPDSYRHEV